MITGDHKDKMDKENKHPVDACKIDTGRYRGKRSDGRDHIQQPHAGKKAGRGACKKDPYDAVGKNDVWKGVHKHHVQKAPYWEKAYEDDRKYTFCNEAERMIGA